MQFVEKTALQALVEVEEPSRLFKDYYGRVWAAINDAIQNKDKYVNMILPSQTEQDEEAINKIEERLTLLGFEVKLENWNNSNVTRVIIDWKHPKSCIESPKKYNTEDLI